MNENFAEHVRPAVDLTFKLICIGRTDDVRAALELVGAAKVSQMSPEQTEIFMELLP